jgi:DNA-binding NtrC family response regulator
MSSMAKRILIVDDNVGLAENIAEILSMDGHVTFVAASAEEALADALSPSPDVVVTDYRLPGISGAMLLRRLSAQGLRLRTIVMSAFTDDKTIEDAHSVGAEFVPKPLDFGALGRLIDVGGALG